MEAMIYLIMIHYIHNFVFMYCFIHLKNQYCSSFILFKKESVHLSNCCLFVYSCIFTFFFLEPNISCFYRDVRPCVFDTGGGGGRGGGLKKQDNHF